MSRIKTAGIALALLVVFVFGWRFSTPTKAKQPATNPAASASSSAQPIAGEEARSLKQMLQGFVENYYSVKEEWFETGDMLDAAEAYKAAVQPYVTNEFLATSLMPLDVPANQFVIKQDGSVLSTLDHIDGQGISEKMQLSIVVKTEEVYADATRVSSRGSHVLVVVREDQTWKVAAVIE